MTLSPFCTIPSLTPTTVRSLTPNEARYLRSVARGVSGLLLAALAILLVGAVGSIAVGSWVMWRDSGSTVGMVLLMSFTNLLMIPLIVYVVRRLRRPWAGREVQRISGTFETKRWDLGEASFDVHSIDGHSIFVPDHWRGYLEQAQAVTAEVCFDSVRGLDAAVYGSRTGFVLSVDGRLSVDREVPQGLLSTRESPLIVLAMAFVATASVGITFVGLAGSDDTALLIRHWRGRGGTQVFDSVRALAQARPPERTHVEIARATLLTGPLGTPHTWNRLVDIDQRDRDAWRDFRPRLMASVASSRDYEWRMVARTFWFELLDRHAGHILEVSRRQSPWPLFDLDDQVAAFEAALREPRRVRGTFRSHTSDDDKTVLTLELGEPQPLPEPTSLRLLLAGLAVTLGVVTTAWLRLRRRRRIVKRLAASIATA